MSIGSGRPLPKIVVVDDDDIVSDTLKAYLEGAGFVVEKARDGIRGLELALRDDVALVVLDLMIPGLSGQEVCRRLRQTSRVPILVLTARTAENDRIAGLEMGADDYVPKPFSPREVVARVRALLRRMDRAIGADESSGLQLGELHIDLWSRQARIAEHMLSLTPTEWRILEALARHPGRAFAREELLAQVFGPDYVGMDRTLDTHVTNLRRKLAAHSDKRYVLTVHGVGYRLVGRHDLPH